ncbi:MAG: GGDEF domain-containing protein, partial [Treponema sp.]|nr:GGDEF domain-containing protein [Treponema sp.]
MMDIDFFKLVNDRYGHIEGDNCLRNIAYVLKKIVRRPSDLIFRYGGEEMGCILPETGFSGANEIAERIRAAVEQQKIPNEDSSVSDFVTVSIGVITIECKNTLTPDQIVKRCDSLLYEAKQSGRNCIAAENNCFIQ